MRCVHQDFVIELEQPMKRKLFAALCAIGLAGAAQAAPVSFGSLSSNDDGSTEIISDALNNLEWLRWDVEADLTYQETVDLISTGARAGEGWAIANADKARAFTDALFGTNPCSNATDFATCRSDLPLDLSLLLGDNYNVSDDFAWFLYGNLEEGAFGAGTLNFIVFLQGWNLSLTFLHRPFHTATRTQPAVLVATLKFLAFCTATPPAPVPVPASLPLLAVGLGGLGYLARRKRQLR